MLRESKSYKSLEFTLRRWEALSRDEIYAILRLRQEVFIVEQTCYYLDADGRDQGSYHLFSMESEGCVAYARLLPRGLSYPDYVSIGRVVTHLRVRRSGVGRKLMAEAIRHCREIWPGIDIKISAQCYLEGFYKSFGFWPVGPEYLEDGIPHQAMILTVAAAD